MHDSLLHLEDDDMEWVMFLRGVRFEDFRTTCFPAFLPNTSERRSTSQMHAKEAAPPEEPRDENNRIAFDQEALSCALNNILVFSGPGNSCARGGEETGLSSYEAEAEMDLSEKRQMKRTSEQEGCESWVKQYMDPMDTGLENTALGQSSTKKQLMGMECSFSDIESIDIDMQCRLECMF